MKWKFLLALLAIGVISGCHGYGHLYPVRGPLASLSPVPTYTFSIAFPGAPKSDGTERGEISMVLADKEAFSGPWKMVYHKPGDPVSSGASPESNTMAAAWDAVYGEGFYVAHILGANRVAHITLTGTEGTTLQIEWWDQGPSDGTTIVGTKGVAQDSKGNIYKLAW